MESCFGFLGSFNEAYQPIDVFLVGELRHVVEKHLEEKFGDVGALMFLAIDGLADQLGNNIIISFQELSWVIALALIWDGLALCWFLGRLGHKCGLHFNLIILSIKNMYKNSK